MERPCKQSDRLAVLLVCGLVALITVGVQFSHHGKRYILGRDLRRHQDRAAGVEQAPYRYRLLTDLVLSAVLRVTPGDVSRKYLPVALAFRLAQNLLIALLAYAYYRQLGMTRLTAFAALGVLGYGLCAAFHQSDLSYYSYTELALCLGAAVLIGKGRDWTIVPLALVAAFNRESAVFLPVMLLAARCPGLPSRRTLEALLRDRRPVVAAAAIGLAGCVVVYVSLRLALGPAPYAGSRYGDVQPGLRLLLLNVCNPATWTGLGRMYSLTPLALLAFRRWPRTLQAYFVWLVLPWFALHFGFGSADETRLFLVPLALVFAPAACLVVADGCRDENARGHRVEIAAPVRPQQGDPRT